jgi:hypothetical protein
MTFHKGQPLDQTRTGYEIIGDPFAGVSHSFQKTASFTGEHWINPAAFCLPAIDGGTAPCSGPNIFGGDLRRNQIYGPGYSSVDMSVLKTISHHRAREGPIPSGVLQPLQPHQPRFRGGRHKSRWRLHHRHHRRLQRRTWYRPRRSLQYATWTKDSLLTTAGFLGGCAVCIRLICLRQACEGGPLKVPVRKYPQGNLVRNRNACYAPQQ